VTFPAMLPASHPSMLPASHPAMYPVSFPATLSARPSQDCVYLSVTPFASATPGKS
ncbi:Uncharacterized protein APZ42_006080, partial [Daphnia magna]